MGVAFHKMAAAKVMRRLPVQVRKVRYLRDRAYVRLGGGGWDEDDVLDASWPTELQKVRGHNGMLLELDLTDWCQRRTYFTGRYYQEALEDLISLLVRAGDTFIDIGANIGVVTLHAASRGAKVWSFEPNPEVYDRLLRHLRINGLEPSRALNIGLGNADGTMSLNLFGRHTGKASLVEREGQPKRTVSVAIRRGDEVLKLDPEKPTLIKIDVEGFEVSALEGTGAILDGDVAVICEVSPDWLRRAGSSTDELFDLMALHGLEPYSFGIADTWFGRKLTVSRMVERSDDQQYDCLFIRPGSAFERRIPRPSSATR